MLYLITNGSYFVKTPDSVVVLITLYLAKRSTDNLLIEDIGITGVLTAIMVGGKIPSNLEIEYINKKGEHFCSPSVFLVAGVGFEPTTSGL